MRAKVESRRCQCDLRIICERVCVCCRDRPHHKYYAARLNIRIWLPCTQHSRASHTTANNKMDFNHLWTIWTAHKVSSCSLITNNILDGFINRLLLVRAYGAAGVHIVFVVIFGAVLCAVAGNCVFFLFRCDKCCVLAGRSRHPNQRLPSLSRFHSNDRHVVVLHCVFCVSSGMSFMNAPTRARWPCHGGQINGVSMGAELESSVWPQMIWMCSIYITSPRSRNIFCHSRCCAPDIGSDNKHLNNLLLSGYNFFSYDWLFIWFTTDLMM